MFEVEHQLVVLNLQKKTYRCDHLRAEAFVVILAHDVY